MEMLQGLLITGIKIYQVSTKVCRDYFLKFGSRYSFILFYLVFSKNNLACIIIDVFIKKDNFLAI
jgi:hypothetical protein